MLINWPTGISWSTIPGFKSNTDQQLTAAANLCVAASDQINEYCETVLRATINTEVLYGPGTFRLQLSPNGNGRALLSACPITFAVSGSVQAATDFSGSTAQSIPASSMKPERPLRGVYGTNTPSSAGEVGQTMLIAPGYVNWWRGRESVELSLTYCSGWPHGSLTTGATAGANTLQVDDITGWWNPVTQQGACGTVYDASADMQEVVFVQSVTPATPGAIAGPGTLNLVNNLVNSHSDGTIVSSLPGTVINAAVYFAVAKALLRGATATVVPTLGGATGIAHNSPDELVTEAELMIHPYRRTF